MFIPGMKIPDVPYQVDKWQLSEALTLPLALPGLVSSVCCHHTSEGVSVTIRIAYAILSLLLGADFMTARARRSFSRDSSFWSDMAVSSTPVSRSRSAPRILAP